MKIMNFSKQNDFSAYCCERINLNENLLLFFFFISVKMQNTIKYVHKIITKKNINIIKFFVT